jgi:hypothetical protein
VTGGITYGEEYRNVSFLGSVQCFLAPRIPINWISAVLQKVRADLID